MPFQPTTIARLTILPAIALLFFVDYAHGNTVSVLQEARKAIDENVPQVAIFKVQGVLAGQGLSVSDRQAATRLLVEAQLAGEKYSDVVEVLKAGSEPLDRPGFLLLARAYVGLGDWEKALPIYANVEAMGDPPLEAMLGKAEALQGLGRTAEAAKLLTTIVASGQQTPSIILRLSGLLVELGKIPDARKFLGDPRLTSEADVQWRRYIEARILLREKKWADALAAFEAMLKTPARITENLLVAMTLGATEARLEVQGAEAADNALEAFLWKNPDCAHLELIFRRLDQVYAMEKNTGEGELHRMAKQPPARRAALAQYYVTRLQFREKRYEKAGISIQVFLDQFEGHPLTPLIHQIRAEIALLNGGVVEAERAYVAAVRTAAGEDQLELRAEMEMCLGLLYFQQGEFLLAEKFFKSAAELLPRLTEPARFNTALAWLKQGNLEQFSNALQEFRSEFPGAEGHGDLVLEEGLIFARNSRPRARDHLRKFLGDFTAHPRRGEAQLALAELAFLEGNPEQAQKLIADVPEAAPSEVTDEKDYLNVFIEDAKKPRDEERVIQLARTFVRKYPASALLAEVRMKLGQIYFARGDFANAQVQFESVAREQPKGAYLETALFLAGQSAMKLMSNEGLNRAVELFEEVARREGPFKLRARLEEAIIYTKLGKEEDAVKLYEQILGAQPVPDAEVLYAAYCGKGDVHAALGKSDPKQLEAAVTVYDQLASLNGVTAVWRNQALYKKGKALELLKREDAAQAAYFDALERGEQDGGETFWYYKAGFDSARAYEGKRSWKSAIAIYEKMTRVSGPRLEEAKARVKQLRLEHFLWD